MCLVIGCCALYEKFKVFECYTKYVPLLLWSNNFAIERLNHTQIKLVLRPEKKYILRWTEAGLPGWDQSNFVKDNCSENKCFFTSDRHYFKNITTFHAIIFNGPEISRHNISKPKMRTPEQLYIFESRESSKKFPICNKDYNSFFNLSWTYKLNSDILNVYFVIRDRYRSNNIIGPRQAVRWIRIDKMLPVSDDLRNKINTKSKAAAWFKPSSGLTKGRESFVKQLFYSLLRYGLRLDIYEHCDCDQVTKACWDLLERDYYFYLALEDFPSEDYVTDTLLKALQHYTVPIVYGSTNYSRFMPQGTYLNAMELKPTQTAKRIFEIINNKRNYTNFFKWHKHYTYHKPNEAPDSSNYCYLCKILHDKHDSNHSIDNFVEWWNDNPTIC